MSKSRIMNMVVGAGLILTTLVALMAIGLSAAAKERGSFYAGMGELKRYEHSQSLQESEVQESSQLYTGMADWRRFEVQQSMQNSREQPSAPNTGMADWRRFEVQQSMQSNQKQPDAPYTGMADWRRFEVQQAIQNAGVNRSANLYAGMGDLHRSEAP